MRLRLLDLGGVSGLRSQAVYHALGESISEGAMDTLAILHPTNPYVSLGFHRDLDTDVDTAFCRERGLPVYRRRVGGGTVYLDADQVFFQLILQERRARTSVANAYAEFLGPAAVAYRALGVPAELMGVNDLAVDGRKLSGTGMATIGNAVVVVGNVIRDLDHASMAGIMQLPDDTARTWVETSMRRWVTSIQGELGSKPSYARVATELVKAYAAWAGEPLVPGRLSDRELDQIRTTERRLESSEWLHREGYERPAAHAATPVRRVKIRAGRWDAFFDWASGDQPIRVYMSADGGVLEAIRFARIGGAADVDAPLRALEGSLPGTNGGAVDLAERLASTVPAADANRLAGLLAIAARPDG